MKITSIKILLVMVFLTAVVNASVLYVDNNLSDGFWDNAYSDLQEALTAAQSGDEIWVAQGTYAPGASRDNSFVLKSGVKLYGGFSGGEISLEDRDYHINTTILSGEINNLSIASDNSYHVLSYSGPLDSGTIIDGLVISGGYADDGNGGGGMLLTDGASPLIRNCRFVDNYSTTVGGAANIKNAPVFDHCLFESNTAQQGGAVSSIEDRTQTGNAAFDHCTFVSNIAGTGSALYFEKRESAIVDSSIFWNNTDGSGNVNTLSLDTKISSSSVSMSAFDDASITANSITDLIYYSSSETDGPFLNLSDYRLDNDHSIPREWGWYYVPSPLVLNIRLFLEGAF